MIIMSLFVVNSTENRYNYDSQSIDWIELKLNNRSIDWKPGYLKSNPVWTNQWYFERRKELVGANSECAGASIYRCT